MHRTPLAVFIVFLRLGCTAFGGPAAHLGYFRNEFVVRRKWLGDDTYAQCIALTQLLPGPGSSQTGMLIGWLAAGPLGALAAWTGFTLPSAVLMCAIGVATLNLSGITGVLHGVLIVAVGVVASAIVSMRVTLAPDAVRLLMALGAFALFLVAPPLLWAAVIVLAAVLGIFVLQTQPAPAATLDLHVPRWLGGVLLAAFAILTIAAIAVASPAFGAAGLFGGIYAAGATVFGGGHVVLPLLQHAMVDRGFVSEPALLTGYAAAQAMPGPLFTIASYVGATAFGGALGVRGAFIGTVAIFAPSFLLVPGVAPFYTSLAASARFRRALAGANAAVLGVLCAAFVTPIWTTAIHGLGDGLLALVAFTALHVAKIPPWAVVLTGAAAGFVLYR